MKNWKKNDWIFSHFQFSLIGNYSKNDPVGHKYYYFIMVNWGERLIKSETKSLPDLRIGFTDNAMCNTICYQK